MKKFLSIIAVSTLVFAAASCSEDSGEDNVPATGIAVLNNGNWGGNDASITIYDIDTKMISDCAFEAANSQQLGDLGQDWLTVGDKVYIAVNGSKIVFETDKNFKIISDIKASDDTGDLSPRSLATDGKNVYITYYEGYLGKYNISTGLMELTEVGPNPEGVAIAGGKAYVANSGGYMPGYNNTVSVVNLTTFKEEKTITVNTNPAAVAANKAGTYVYVSSLGNYADVASKVQAIKVADGSVSDLDYTSVSGLAYSNDKLYILCAGYDSNWNPLPGTIYAHDAAANTKLGKFSTTTVPQAYSIFAGDGYVFVGSSDYTTNGDMYVYDATGTFKYSFDTNGLNPQKAMAIK